MKGFRREDDYLTRRESVKDLNDIELKDKFWEYIGDIVDPLLDMAKEYTSPSIERSVLLRMGISSMQANQIVEACLDHSLIEYGAGHVVYATSKNNNISINDAADALVEGKYWHEVKAYLEAL